MHNKFHLDIIEMNTLESYNVVELNQAELVETEGGIAFVLGCLVGVCIGACCVYAGYHIIEYFEEG